MPVEHLNLFSRKALISLFEKEGFECIAQKPFGSNTYEKYVPQPYKSAYDKISKLFDFGATLVVYFKQKNFSLTQMVQPEACFKVSIAISSIVTCVKQFYRQSEMQPTAACADYSSVIQKLIYLNFDEIIKYLRRAKFIEKSLCKF